MGDERGVNYLLTTLANRKASDRGVLATDLHLLAREKPEVLGPLVSRVASFVYDPDGEVRTNATAALRDVHDPQADATLATLLHDGDPRTRSWLCNLSAA